MISKRKAKNIKKLICDGTDNEIIYLKTVTSTNDYLRELAYNGAKNSTVVIAHGQTAGKGRKGRSFYSPAGGGIYLSYLYRPDADVDLSSITPRVAVATYKAINEVTGVDTDIKWVNDIVLNGKKICGILTESNVINTGSPFIVIGIGINVNTPSQAFTGELKNIASSFFVEKNEKYDVDLLTATVIEQLNLLLSDRLDNVFQIYRQKCINIGKEVFFVSNGEEKHGIAKGIDEHFHLLVEVDGELLTLSSGIVSIRSKDGYC